MRLVEIFPQILPLRSLLRSFAQYLFWFFCPLSLFLPMILTPCCILLLPFPAFLLSILSFFAVTLPCYSFGSSFYQRKLQISKHAVGGEANSCFFFILRFYHCSESLSSNPQSCNLFQCSKPSTSRLGPAILQPPASGRVSSTRASGSSHNHSSWLRAPPGLRILHIPFQLLWLFLNVQTFFWSICFIHLRPFSSTARHPRRRIAWLYSTQHFPPIHHAFLSSEVSTSSSVLRTPPACYFCVSPIRASRSYFNTQAWQICQIAFSSELMYADLPALAFGAFLALRRHCEKIVLAAESEAFKSRLWARLRAQRAPAVIADPRKPASSSLHRTLAPLHLF